MTKAKPNRWYAARIKPGFQRMAAKAEGRPEGEIIIERNFRLKGIDFYHPAYWVETIHHRKKIWLEKRYPLLVGYCFVNLPGFDFELVRKVDGVMCILRGGRDFGPIEFPENVVAELRLADFHAHQEYLFEQHKRTEDERLEKVRKLRANLRRMLPKGRAVRVSMVDQAEKIIDSLPEKVREHVKSIVAELNSLTGDQAFSRVA